MKNGCLGYLSQLVTSKCETVAQLTFLLYFNSISPVLAGCSLSETSVHHPVLYSEM